jgi:hypothetical protein
MTVEGYNMNNTNAKTTTSVLGVPVDLSECIENMKRITNQLTEHITAFRHMAIQKNNATTIPWSTPQGDSCRTSERV